MGGKQKNRTRDQSATFDVEDVEVSGAKTNKTIKVRKTTIAKVRKKKKGLLDVEDVEVSGANTNKTATMRTHKTQNKSTCSTWRMCRSRGTPASARLERCLSSVVFPDPLAPMRP